MVLNQVYWRLISTSKAKNVVVSPSRTTPDGAHQCILRVSSAPPTRSCSTDHFRIATEYPIQIPKLTASRRRRNGAEKYAAFTSHRWCSWLPLAGSWLTNSCHLW